MNRIDRERLDRELEEREHVRELNKRFPTQPETRVYQPVLDPTQHPQTDLTK